jgi:outer membrane lipoprotein SlyB
MTDTITHLSAPPSLKPSKPFAAAFAVLALALAGCASGLGANTYERASVGTVARVEEGTVVASRSVIIEGSRTGATVGTAAGAALGGIAGSEVGGGHKANTAGAIVGAVAGGVIGNAIGNSASRQPGFAYTVRLRSGELISITQGGDLPIANGTPVLVEYGERARVIPQNVSIGY